MPKKKTGINKRAEIIGATGVDINHESGHLHVCGEALYTDDIPEPIGTLHAAIGVSERAHAKIKFIDLESVLVSKGVHTVVSSKDVPGKNNFGPVLADDPIFNDEIVQYVGHIIFAVAADTVLNARRAALKAVVKYEDIEAILDTKSAIAKESFVLPTENMSRGEADKAISRALHQLKGRHCIGGQDQFYLEGHIAFAIPKEDNVMFIYSSTQHPGEVQHQVSTALGIADHNVVVECRRLGGGFGGKETQPGLFACIAAILARKTQRAVKLRIDRDYDMEVTGKRHGFEMDYDVGFDSEGVIEGIKFVQAANCGMSADLSGPVCDRAMFHSDNCYFLENIDIKSYRCKTNTVSNTAFRGFGGPQGMLAIEHVINEIARYLNKDPLQIRRANFYGMNVRNTTPYLMKIEDNVIHEIVDELEISSDYQKRRQEILEFNKNSEHLKKGIALTPVKFGISFTATHFNQAGALLHVYSSDGSVLLNHGGVEMGQGLFTKVAQVVAEELQIDIDKVKCTATDTSKVANASATAASSGSDLNAMAALAAAREIKDRLIDFAAKHYKVAKDKIIFHKNEIRIGNEIISFKDLVAKAYFARISLSASGYYRTPKINYDRATFSGRPFYYFAYGAAVSEILIDAFTGENRLLRVDILHDVGKSLNPAIDLGQIEGGFLQGAGWLTTEELCWNNSGRLTTHAPSTYKIPTCSDWPVEYYINIWKSGINRENTIYKSKAVGEPPLMLAISVLHAIKDAVASIADYQFIPDLINAPATPEEILNGVDRANVVKTQIKNEREKSEKVAM